MSVPPFPRISWKSSSSWQSGISPNIWISALVWVHFPKSAMKSSGVGKEREAAKKGGKGGEHSWELWGCEIALAPTQLPIQPLLGIPEQSPARWEEKLGWELTGNSLGTHFPPVPALPISLRSSRTGGGDGSWNQAQAGCEILWKSTLQKDAGSCSSPWISSSPSWS